ncbi:M3 family metallopeptidase [Capnocytophaga sputigena]|jgi:peptidyl-dipeptidase dcp|uniref:Oligopeptidase A n=1 Tax=Capnocytophaga sputigena TaxID=1019 RepID=A0AAX2I9D9_CAPSP|nr:M3 family metallopeptidase [Capnocytophaga sputigena]ATA85190.1 peptidase M3 [Capnocytophaga sputigena]EEB65230.1 peptidase family M3 [Capnocytophaga sputigena ATCC 33612]SQA74714.1 Oligopeptidase A [Capnocytophaga sputigena]
MFQTPYNAAPFSRFTPTDYLPAIEKAIAESLAQINSITQNPEPATFKNTIEALAYTGLELDRLTAMFFNLNSAETNEALQAEAQRISPLLTDYGNDIRLNEALFKRVKTVYDQRENLSLTAEQQTLLEKTYKSFTRNGANLSLDDKERLRKIDKELATLKLKFSENALAETQHYQWVITDKNTLSGLPDFVLEMLAQEAKKRNVQGWVITLDLPVYTAVMKYADNRDLRQKLFTDYHSRCAGESAYNNETNVLRIAQLRQARASLLGYPNYATFALEERMAETPEKVIAFLNEQLEKDKPQALKELEELKTLSGLTDFQQWDFAYYAEKLKQERYQIDDSLLKPYLALDKAVEGMFAVAHKLYGLHFTLTNEVEKYHPEVQTYKVTDENGNYLALFYTDFFPRAGKRNGAWMTSYKEQYRDEQGNDSRPHISIVCNFTRPTDTAPSLLTFSELTTLFHEFGHALHGILSKVTYPSLSGTNVARDFVELPSQLMENWCYEEETLRLFATHYQTGEPLPIEWVKKVKAVEDFMKGILNVRQLNFGFLDMEWHTYPHLERLENVRTFEQTVTKATQLYPPIDEMCISPAFSHIFSGGYAAGYYSYKWSEALEEGALKIFKEAGFFNKTVATRFRKEILERGSSEKESILYKRFRG